MSHTCTQHMYMAFMRTCLCNRCFWLHRLCRCKSGRDRTHGDNSCALQQQPACSTCASTQMRGQLCRQQAQFRRWPACVIWIGGLLRWYATRLLPWPALQWDQMSRYVGLSNSSSSSGWNLLHVALYMPYTRPQEQRLHAVPCELWLVMFIIALHLVRGFAGTFWTHEECCASSPDTGHGFMYLFCSWDMTSGRSYHV